MQVRDIIDLAHDPDCTEVRYQKISLRQKIPVNQPAFLFGAALPERLRPYLFDEHEAGPVGVFRVAGGAVSCHGALYYRGTGVFSPSWNLGRGALTFAAGKSDIKDFSVPTRHIEGALVSLVGPGKTVWGHWLVDFLPRLYTLHIAGYDIYEQRYLLPRDTPQFAIELLKSLGIGEASLEWFDDVAELVSCDDLIVPTYLRVGRYFSPLFREASAFLLQSFAARQPLLPPLSAPRLFITRSGGRPQRVLKNRDEIETIMAQRGFTIVDPVKHSISEQIALFTAARQIAGEYGSGLHN